MMSCVSDFGKGREDGETKKDGEAEKDYGVQSDPNCVHCCIFEVEYVAFCYGL